MSRIEIMNIVDPEATAMLQAFYSRSPMPIRERLHELGAEWMLDPIKGDRNLDGLKSKLAQFYVGYGHESIGELGEIVIFIEDVSIVAAKAVQHHPLYQGQEVSTRYVDFSKQGVLAGYETKVQPWRALYIDVLPEIRDRVAAQHQDVKDDKAFTKTVNARAFDIARGLLPAAFLTSLAWKTNFRNALHHCNCMRAHPLSEVRHLGELILTTLKDRYPSAFPEMRPLLNDGPFKSPWSSSRDNVVIEGQSIVQEFVAWNEHRDGRYYTIKGTLDYGSWRDIARHRNGYLEWAQPSRTIFNGIGESNWYLSQMGKTIADRVMSLAWDFIPDENYDDDVYLAPLMTPVNVVATWHVSQLRYVMALRTGKTVHESLRLFMQDIHKLLVKCDDDFSTMKADLDPDSWTLKRGTQDIVKKGE